MKKAFIYYGTGGVPIPNRSLHLRDKEELLPAVSMDHIGNGVYTVTIGDANWEIVDATDGNPGVVTGYEIRAKGISYDGFEPEIEESTSGKFWDGTKTFRAITMDDIAGLAAALSSEAAARATGDSTEAAARATAVAGEATARATAIASLQTKIDNQQTLEVAGFTSLTQIIPSVGNPTGHVVVPGSRISVVRDANGKKLFADVNFYWNCDAGYGYTFTELAGDLATSFDAAVKSAMGLEADDPWGDVHGTIMTTLMSSPGIITIGNSDGVTPRYGITGFSAPFVAKDGCIHIRIPV